MSHLSVGTRPSLSAQLRLVAVVAVGALLVAACSGPSNSDSATASTAAGPVTTAPAADTPATATTAGSPSTTPSSLAPTTSRAPATTTTPTDSDGSSGEAIAAGLVSDGDSEACDDPGAAPGSSVLTFVSGGRLWSTDGRQVDCLADLSGFGPHDPAALSPGTTGLSWNPSGDTAVLEAPGNPRVVVGGSAVASGQLLGWTWPTGTKFVAEQADTLTKVPTDDSTPEPLDSILDLTAFSYHPDGQHIAMAGEAFFRHEFPGGDDTVEVEEFTTNGIHITDNLGADPHTLVWTNDDVTIHDVVFSADGRRVHFVAEHPAAFHVHSLDLADLTDELDDGERLLTSGIEDPELLVPLAESVAPYGDLVIDPHHSDRILVSVGACGDVLSTELIDVETGGYPQPIAPELNAVPVGFVGASHVAVLDLAAGCGSPGDLWLIDLVSGDRTLVATDVSAAGTRWSAPDLAYTLVDVTIVGFA